MTEMSPEARRLLGLARRGDDLREADRARLTQRVAQRLTLAAGAAGMTLVSAKAASGAGFALLLGKGAAVGVLITATTFGVWKAAEQVSSSHSAATARSAALALGPATTPPAAVNEQAPTLAVPRQEAPLPPTALNEQAPTLAVPRQEAPLPPTALNEQALLPSRNDGFKDDVLRNRVVAAPHKPKPILGNSDAFASPSPVANLETSDASGLDAFSRSGAKDPLEDEVMSFRTVQQSIAAGDARRALTLITEQNRRYSAGALQQERAAARVFALCALGRNSEARSEAVVFERHWPRSPMLARVRRACEGEASK